ncbi:MAG: choline-sulfatase [Planctomycetaceae bacterium]|nr:MAG: choline-sulfatase [Planctomycetaceae bacterium]
MNRQPSALDFPRGWMLHLGSKPPRVSSSSRRQRVCWCWGVALLLVCAVRPLVGQDTPRRSLPNVLMVCIDDQNDWIGVLGKHPSVQTPHLDALARKGVLFTNAHCQAPLCNPSRTSLFLGLRPSTTGIYGLSPWFRQVDAWRDRVTLPQYLRKHGYLTLATGKVYHGVPGGPRARQLEFDIWGPGGGIGAKPPQKLIPPTPMGNHPLMDWGVFPHQEEQKGDYQITSWAIEQLQKLPTDRPFFLAVGYFLPHVPCYVPPSYWELYPDDDSLLPPLRDDDRQDTPRFSWYLHWYLPEPRWRWVAEHQQARSLIRSYLASTSFVDAQIGRLLTALANTPHASQTLIVVWSDHGWHLGEKGITGKNTLWERSTHVPLIFAGPNIAPGQTCDEPVELLDVYPTVLELCGLPIPADLEGHSLVPWCHQPQQPRPWPAITTHNQGNHAVRSREWRYIRYADGSEELYHLSTDPHEWHNLATRSDLAPVLAAHRRWLPRLDAPPAPGSEHRILTYDPATDEALWEGKLIRRDDPIPE